MNSIVNLKDGFITFNSNIDHSLSFSKCGIGYSNYNVNSHERGSLVFLTNNEAISSNLKMETDIRMCITSSGNVGIGSSNPTQKLDIGGNTNIANILKIGDINLSSSDIKLQVYSADTTNSLVAIFKHPNNSQGVGITYDSIIALGGISRTNQPIIIKSLGNDNVILNTNSLDRVTVLGNGNVGIGTTNPIYNLDINASSGSSILRIISSAENNSILMFRELNDRFGFDITYEGFSNKLLFRGYNDTIIPSNYIIIARDTGNVGIGTDDNTTNKLTVNGLTQINGGLCLNISNPYIRFLAHDNNSLIGRVSVANTFSTNSAIDDIVIRSGTGRVHLQSGIGNPALTSTLENNIIVRNSLIINKTTLTSGFALDIEGGINTSGTITCGTTGGMIWTTGTGALGRANLQGHYSSSSIANDIVLRSGSGRLLLQSGNEATGMIIHTNNNVAIGNIIPQTILDINGNLLIRAYATTGSGTRGLFFRQDFATTNVYNCSILTFDHSNTGPTDGLSINGNGGVSFCTGSNARQERMCIASNGYVGIGVTNPAYRMHFKTTYGEFVSGLHLDASDTAGPNQYALTIWPYVVNNAQVGWRFRTQSQIGGLNTPLLFNHAGNVGIGTDSISTSYRLHVEGSVNAGSYFINGVAFAPYVLPMASSSTLGGIKRGNNIDITGDGTTSVNLTSYAGNVLINGNITASNLNILGSSTILNTNVYITERLEIINDGLNNAVNIRQTAPSYDIINVSNITSEVFKINYDGHVTFTNNINNINTTQFSRIADIQTNDTNTSNFVRASSNFLFTDYVARDTVLNTTIATSATNTSNFVSTSSNFLFTDYVARDTVLNTSIATSATNTSNFVSASSNFLFTDYVARDTVLNTSIETNKYTDAKVRTLLNTGNIGIGTTNPNSSLHIHKNGTSQNVRISFTDDTTGIALTSGFCIGKDTLQAGYIYNNTANVDAAISIGTNNVERLRIQGNGNIITNNNNINAGTGTITAATFAGNATTATNASGLTGTPDISVRNITGSGQTNQITNTTNGGVGLDIRNNSTGNNAFTSLGVQNATGSTFLMFLNSSGRSTDGGINTATLRNDAGDLRLSTINNSTFIYLKSSNGNVGIGTTNPTSKLHILTIDVPTPTPVFDFRNSANYGVYATSSAIGSRGMTLDFFARDFNIGSTIQDRTLLSLRPEGNVGIGITNPAHRLDINGTVNASSYLVNGVALSTGSSRWSASSTNIFYDTGNVGIGTTNPTGYKLTVNGTIGASGNITASFSDERLKNITEYVSNVLPILNQINVFKYNCNDLAASFGYDKDKKEIGLSAQEVQKYYPELVSIAPFDIMQEDKDIKSKSGETYLTLDYNRLVPVLLQGIKELNSKYNLLEEKYNRLENLLYNI